MGTHLEAWATILRAPDEEEMLLSDTPITQVEGT